MANVAELNFIFQFFIMTQVSYVEMQHAGFKKEGWNPKFIWLCTLSLSLFSILLPSFSFQHNHLLLFNTIIFFFLCAFIHSSRATFSIGNFNLLQIPVCGCNRSMKMFISNSNENPKRRYWNDKIWGLMSSYKLFICDDELVMKDLSCIIKDLKVRKKKKMKMKLENERKKPIYSSFCWLYHGICSLLTINGGDCHLNVFVLFSVPLISTIYEFRLCFLL